MAQSGAAESSLDKLMEKLAAFEPVDLPVISLYLNAQANQHGRDEFERWLRKELSERAKTFAAQTPERESFDRDVERITEYLGKEVTPEANGIAIFACAGADEFWEAAQFAAPIENHRLYVYNQPHLYPLARLVDQFPRYAVVVADTNRARIFVFGRGRTLDTEEIQNVKTKRSQAGGWSQMRFQRHLSKYHEQHVLEVVDTLDKVVRNDDVKHVILSGDPVVIPLLREKLPKALEEKVVDVLNLPIDAPEQEILAATQEAMRGFDAETDEEKVKQLLDQYRAGGLAVIGSEATLEALSMGQVEELIIAASQQRIEGSAEDVAILSDAQTEVPGAVLTGDDGAVNNITPDAVIVADDLVTRAQQTGARITFIEDPALLESIGGVGAILRYRLQPPTTESAPQPQHA